MRVIRKSAFLILLFQPCFFNGSVFGQQDTGIVQVLDKKGLADTAKVDFLSDKAIVFQEETPDSAIWYGMEGLNLAQKIDYYKGIVKCHVVLGSVYLIKGDYGRSMYYFNRLIDLSDKTGDTRTRLYGYNGLTMNSTQLGSPKKALSYIEKMRQLELGPGAADSLYDYIFNRTYSKIDADIFYDMLTAENYLQDENADSAAKYAQNGQELKPRSSGIYQNNLDVLMGDVRLLEKNPEDALSYYNSPVNSRSRKLTTEIDRWNGKAAAFLALNQIDSSIFFANKSLDSAQSKSYSHQRMKALGILAEALGQSNPSEANRYLKMSIALKDSLFSSEKITQLNTIDFENQMRAREREAIAASARNRIRIWVMTALLLIALVAGMLIWRNSQQRRKANVLLQNEKEKVEKTLLELKATQSQLIQAEKMASLGEMTAGIAHEIQNPLNFVNNFSDLNLELMNEADHAMKKGDHAELAGVLTDLRQNEEKIKEHGNRADGIVKSMLYHARLNTGEKEPVNINRFCDEYLRQAYQAVITKDPGFKVELKTEFDPAVSSINLVPQDMGRVLINLLNNAFYSIQQKIKSSNATYQPIILLKTQKNGDKTEILVRDNGTGIPVGIRDKIFQPFFTTKPAGEGTGLGLSISYNIIKMHGGELNLMTSGEEDTIFCVKL